MLDLITALFLLPLVKLLSATRRPVLCAAVFAGATFLLNLLAGFRFGSVVKMTAIASAFAFPYYWLLDRFHDRTPAYFAILVFGLVALFCTLAMI